MWRGTCHALRFIYATAAAATLDDLREAVTTLEDTNGPRCRVLGSAHPTTVDIELNPARRARRPPRPRDAVAEGKENHKQVA